MTKPTLPQASSSVANLARRRMADLTTAERKVARALLAAYPVAGLETVAELARRAQVSGPTVIRFAAKLGYDGYPDFQQALKHELLARESTPVRQISSRQTSHDSALAQAQHRFQDAVTDTLDGLTEHDVIASAAMLADTSRPVTAVAGRFTIGLAEYFIGHLQQIRPRAGLVYGGPFGHLSHALDMPRRAVLVAFDFRRYQQDTIEFARTVHRRGASVVLVTDPWLSPIAEIADYTFPAAVEAILPFDSLMPAFAVADLLITAVIERIGDPAEQRVRQLDELTEPSNPGRAVLLPGDALTARKVH
jgi:DNA-binding MurR/RpiR family transcriptional regulator